MSWHSPTIASRDWPDKAYGKVADISTGDFGTLTRDGDVLTYIQSSAGPVDETFLLIIQDSVGRTAITTLQVRSADTPALGAPLASTIRGHSGNIELAGQSSHHCR